MRRSKLVPSSPSAFPKLFGVSLYMAWDVTYMQSQRTGICCGRDEVWSKYQMTRLKSPWTHGVLVILHQSCSTRRTIGKDFCRALVWKRGQPPQCTVQPSVSSVSSPASLAPRAQPASRAQPVAQLQRATADDKFSRSWQKLQQRGVVETGGWCLLGAVLEEIHPFKSNQAARSLKSWRVQGPRGTKIPLVQDQHWKWLKRPKGGGRGEGAVHIQKAALRKLVATTFSNRALRV